jgi:outer membrane receptor protein involved in Fe transport
MGKRSYAQYRAQIKKVSYQLGLRLEHTSSEGDLTTSSTASDKNVKKDYLDFFPSAGISFQLNKKNSLGLSYSRRIDRPKYQDLNPFENKLDELTYQKGNPFLRPQYTNSIELRHTLRFKLTTTLAFSDVQDYFAQITDTVEGKRSYLMQRNLANQKILSLNVSYPLILQNGGVFMPT